MNPHNQSLIATMVQQIEDAQIKVWTFRERHMDTWPTPSRLNSFRFAMTEVAEALDAFMRQLQEFSRNNQKTTDILDELADCALMLITGLGRYKVENLSEILSDLVGGETPTLDEIVMVTSWAFAQAVSFENLEDVYRSDSEYYTSPDNLNEANQLLQDISTAEMKLVEYAVTALGMIAFYPNMDLVDRIDARLQRVEARITA